MNKKNLLLAADGIEGIDPDQFNMSVFRGNLGEHPNSLEYIEFSSKTDCGTLGCALGWCPFIEKLAVKDDEFQTARDDWTGEKIKDLNYEKYAERIFGVVKSLKWEYMFAGNWRIYDNTPQGAANRIREIANGKNVTSKDLPWEITYE